MLIGHGFVGVAVLLILVIARAMMTRIRRAAGGAAAGGGGGGRVVPEPPPPGARFVTVSGLRLRYTDSGAIEDEKGGSGGGGGGGGREGPSSRRTLVLIHGFFGCLETWLPLTRRISRDMPDARTVALDLVGCGFSEKPLDWGYTHREQGAVVAGLLEALDLTGAVLVGHSSGAIAAAAAASLAPDRVVGAVFVAPGFHMPKPPLLSRRPLSPLVGFLAGRFLRDRSGTMRRYHGNRDALTPEVAGAHDAAARALHAREAVAAMFRSSEGPYEETLRGVGAPVHFVWAEGDSVAPPCRERIDALASGGGLPAAAVTSAVVKDSGHYIQHEQPRVLSTEIISFMKTLA